MRFATLPPLSLGLIASCLLFGQPSTLAQSFYNPL